MNLFRTGAVAGPWNRPAVSNRSRLWSSGLVLLLLAGCADLETAPEPRVDPLSNVPNGRQVEAANPLASATFWVDPDSPARQQIERWRESRPADAQTLEKIARNPQADWFGDWNADVRAAVDQRVTQAVAAGGLPVLVAYNIPQRDCGGLSGGGGATADGYRGWVRAFAAGLAGRRAAVVLEPDALALMDCLDDSGRELRLELLRFAVGTLADAGALVYLDAGNARWHTPDAMSRLLRSAGIEGATGFALNVSNFIGTDESVRYGMELSRKVGGRHFVIDTSRNGRGPSADGEWCNPEERGLGPAPTAQTGHARVDAFLWIKRPGESDGACRGAPRAGAWWAEYALGLAQRAAF